jgi:hypothetical protein
LLSSEKIKMEIGKNRGKRWGKVDLLVIFGPRNVKKRGGGILYTDNFWGTFNCTPNVKDAGSLKRQT